MLGSNSLTTVLLSIYKKAISALFANDLEVIKGELWLNVITFFSLGNVLNFVNFDES